MEKNLKLQAFKEELYYTSREFGLGLDDKVFHGFYGRSGGVSKDIYNALNCGTGSDDAVEAVAENRYIVAKSVGCDASHLLSLYQVHGNECVVVNEVWGNDSRPEADAFVTDRAGIALGILTADCAPVLFFGQKKNGEPVVAAAHAGWGGALKGVLASAVDGMLALGTEIGSIRACIGPCIGKVSYEVDESFCEKFLQEDEENERFFSAAQRQGHLMFDLAGYCAFKLFKAGVKNVYIKDLDTYFNEEDFFSYRRATYRGEKDYGRQISVIMIKE